MEALDEHQRRFPASQLVESREAMRIEALVGIGEREAAQRLATAFRSRFPHSVLLVDISQALREP
ncbi:MAG: hypothetical protein HY901_00595 [Deltaproteobacteria bacterium]|nr:hypothetical protein [Deltaproteobacteria bacterium]